MHRAEEGELRLHIAAVALAEVVFWVLRSFYRRSMAEIADVLVRLVAAPGITTADRDRTIEALELARDQNVDDVDAVLVLEAAHHETVATFDQTDFKRLPASWIEPR